MYEEIADWLNTNYNMETDLLNFSSNDHATGFSQFFDSVDDYRSDLQDEENFDLSPTESDWNIVDNKFSQDLLIYSMAQEVNYSFNQGSDFLPLYSVDNPCIENLDSLPDIFETEQKQTSVGKKIDSEKQCYVVDKNCDNNTYTDSSINIKQEVVEYETFKSSKDVNVLPTPCNVKLEPENEQNDSDKELIDVESVCIDGNPILEAPDILNLLEQFEATEVTQLNKPEPTKQIKADEQKPPTQVKNKIKKLSKQNQNLLRKKLKKSFEVKKSQPSTSAVNKSYIKPQEAIIVKPSFEQEVAKLTRSSFKSEKKEKSKQILEALPKELITRIKNNASLKRKPITVIEPIPPKVRVIKKASTVEVVIASQDKNDPIVDVSPIRLDHSYCETYSNEVKIENVVEAEPCHVLNHQPTVTNSNGKVMISLLKNNTIRNNLLEEDKTAKRKLNIEEYKKRRGARSLDNSASNSPRSSGCTSPLTVVEDENTRYIKHKQLLNEMAAEVLSAQPKSIRNKTEVSIPKSTNMPFPPPLSLPILTDETPKPSLPTKPKPAIKSITLVAIGVNTDISGEEEVTKTLIPAKEIEEIKPILESAKNKINRHSLITTVLENVEEKHNTLLAPKTHSNSNSNSPTYHGEDKTIIYEEKPKNSISTSVMSTQTDLSLPIKITSKRLSSENSYSRSSGRRSSNSSYSSRSDSPISISDSYYSSPSRRSRSPSPRRYYNGYSKSGFERVQFERACEERRILFVGGIESNCTESYLKRRFTQFGPISSVRLHFRRNCDNYGFVTFLNVNDTHQAVEHGNDDPSEPRYSLSYGGRRFFCKTTYADLDYVDDRYNYMMESKDIPFDDLLASYQYKQFKRKTKEM